MDNNNLQIVLHKNSIINDLIQKMEKTEINDECKLCKKLRERLGKNKMGRIFKCVKK